MRNHQPDIHRFKVHCTKFHFLLLVIILLAAVVGCIVDDPINIEEIEHFEYAIVGGVLTVLDRKLVIALAQLVVTGLLAHRVCMRWWLVSHLDMIIHRHMLLYCEIPGHSPPLT